MKNSSVQGGLYHNLVARFFFGQQFNNLSSIQLSAAGCTFSNVIVQYDKDSSQIWSTVADYGELCVWF